jgi:hypothetical protein
MHPKGFKGLAGYLKNEGAVEIDESVSGCGLVGDLPVGRLLNTFRVSIQ